MAGEVPPALKLRRTCTGPTAENSELTLRANLRFCRHDYMIESENNE
jgi:hypothetical protein